MKGRFEQRYYETERRARLHVLHTDIFGNAVYLLDQHGKPVDFERNITLAERATMAMDALDKRYYPQAELEGRKQ